jgi:hypothetical protein
VIVLVSIPCWTISLLILNLVKNFMFERRMMRRQLRDRKAGPAIAPATFQDQTPQISQRASQQLRYA